jgi:hypothetical protein
MILIKRTTMASLVQSLSFYPPQFTLLANQNELGTTTMSIGVAAPVAPQFAQEDALSDSLSIMDFSGDMGSYSSEEGEVAEMNYDTFAQSMAAEIIDTYPGATSSKINEVVAQMWRDHTA